MEHLLVSIEQEDIGNLDRVANTRHDLHTAPRAPPERVYILPWPVEARVEEVTE